MYRSLGLGLLLVGLICTAGYGQNLLVNSSFDDPAQPAGQECDPNDVANASFPGWDDSTSNVGRNNNFGEPPCPTAGGNSYFMGYSGQTFSRHTYQTVTVPTDAADYIFSGEWSRTVVFGGSATYRAELRTGSDPNGGTEIGFTSFTKSCCDSENAFSPFVVSGAKPAGVTQLTVVIRTNAGSGFGVALHVNNTSLVESDCDPIPNITDVSPLFVVRDTNPFVLTVNGQGFVLGVTDVTLEHADSGATIPASVVNVGGGGNSLTATFDLTGAPLGSWNVLVEVTAGGCPVVALTDALIVMLPAMSNGSFELPDPGDTDCPVTPPTPPDVPTDWQATEFVAWGFENRLNRDGAFEDSDQNATAVSVFPTCPPPDGAHYATTASDTDTGGANAHVFQTIATNPGSDYTFSGFWAGLGNNTVSLRIREGGPAGTELASQQIHAGAGTYDWTFAFLTAQATTEATTVEYQINRISGDENAVHADALAFEICNPPGITVTQTAPGTVINSNSSFELTITGTGFVATPVVQLAKGGVSINADSVAFDNATQIRATFDLTGAPSGNYDVIVKQGGCVGQAPANERLLVAAQMFINGDFEDPTAPVDHGTCSVEDPPVTVLGTPTGWNTNAPSGLNRDGNAPNPSACPSPNGGHYGSVSEGGGGVLQSWQTIAVSTGSEYEFSGLFDAPPGVSVTLRLLNGDENGSPLASTVASDGSGPLAWSFASVSAVAPAGGIMTVMWEVNANGTPPALGGHADGLDFVPSVLCNDPRSDTPVDGISGAGDGYVNQDDFGILQRCLTGSNMGPVPNDPEYCVCLDSEPDGDIDQSDVNAFEACANGAAGPADPGCD